MGDVLPLPALTAADAGELDEPGPDVTGVELELEGLLGSGATGWPIGAPHVSQ